MNDFEAANLPEWLRELYEVVKSAYPDGVPEELYYPLIAVIRLPHGSLAEFISFVFEKEFHVVSNDILRVWAQPGTPGSVSVNEEQVQEVRNSLLSWGLYDWEATYD